MLLTVDIGNTNITMGVFRGNDLLFVSRLATTRGKTSDQYAVEFKSIFAMHGVDLTFGGAVLSSVVPELSRTISRAVLKLTGKEPLCLGPGVKTGMNILIDNPAQVGSDLVAGAVGAVALYPLPCLVVDLGTATKICLVDKNGAFRGCTIAPGIGISMDALCSRTSQLPAISFSEPSHVVGTNTVDSMQSGIVFGTAAMLDGMCNKIEAEYGEPIATVVATGGLSGVIVKSCERNMIHNSKLILHGLRVIFEKNSK